VEFVVVDDAHFALAGLEPETLGGYYLTEEQGASVAVFPISQRLRYLVPYGAPEETVQYLGERGGSGRGDPLRRRRKVRGGAGHPAARLRRRMAEAFFRRGDGSADDPDVHLFLPASTP
jgi:hypothetical protein